MTANDGNPKVNASSAATCDQVSNDKISLHPCMIKPTNPAFSNSSNVLSNQLQRMKFDVSKLIHSA